jgi:hypothetical protein
LGAGDVHRMAVQRGVETSDPLFYRNILPNEPCTVGLISGKGPVKLVILKATGKGDGKQAGTQMHAWICICACTWTHLNTHTCTPATETVVVDPVPSL